MPDFAIDPVEAQIGTGQQNPLLSNPIQTIQGINQLKLFPLQQQTMQTELATRQQALQAARYGALQTVLAQTTSDDEIPGAYNRAIQAGLIDPQTAAKAMGGAVPNLSLDAIHRLRENAISGVGNAAELAADRGTTSTQNVGGAINTYNTKVAPGGVTTVTQAGGPAASIPLGLSPSEVNTPAYQRFNPQTQQMELITKGAAAANPTNPVGIPGGAPLGAEAAANVAGVGSANMGLALTQRGDLVKDRKAALDNMRDQVDQFASGPQSGLWQGVGAFFSQFGLDPSALNKNLGTNATAAKTEFDKLGLQVLAAQADQAGLSHTDQQNAIAAASSPHATMTPLAIKRMLGVIEGNEDYIKAKSDAWNRWAPNHGAGSYGQFQSAFNSRYDPRVFQSQYLDPEARQTMLKGMSPAQQKLFQARYNDAVSRGLISAEQ